MSKTQKWFPKSKHFSQIVFFLLLIVPVGMAGCGKSDSGGGAPATSWYQDLDKDGYGNEVVSTKSVSRPDGYVANKTDCDDDNPDRHPGNTEIPGDGIDQNCTDKDLIQWYEDVDDDGYGNADGVMLSQEDTPDGYAPNNLDCDDRNKEINPSIVEDPKNDIDDDCDGETMIIWYRDLDADGYGTNVKIIKPNDLSTPYFYAQSSIEASTELLSIMAVSGAGTPVEDTTAPPFVKLDATGAVLDETADQWAAVKDNTTGLIWETKTDKNGYEDAANIHDSDNRIAYADIESQVIAPLNNVEHGKQTDWRLPTLEEFTTLMTHANDEKSTAFKAYFPELSTTPYWTETLNNSNIYEIITINFFIRFVPNDGDCNDSDSSINPGSVEIRDDLINNDCDKDEYGVDIIDETGIIPDTGDVYNHQTIGDDADYLIDPPKYTKLDSAGNVITKRNNQGNVVEDPDALQWAMVRDNVTGLVWEIKQSEDDTPDLDNPNDIDNTYSFNTLPELYFNKLNDTKFGGYENWRLPTAKELQYLINHKGKGENINSTFFNVRLMYRDYYWTSTDAPGNSGAAVCVSFGAGTATTIAKNQTYYTIAVTGTTEPSVFTDNLNGTITDKTTGLMWQKVPQNTPDGVKWSIAVSYCENLKLAGYKDWRLPNINELVSLLEYDKSSAPLINDMLAQELTTLENRIFWSSTMHVNIFSSSDIRPVAVDFNTSNVIEANRLSGIYQVRAVRGNNVYLPEPRTWYRDNDNDGFGDSANQTIASYKPEGYVAEPANASLYDCDDYNENRFPGNPEIVDDGKDQDCTQLDKVTWYRDQDGDGYGDIGNIDFAETQPYGYVSDNRDCDDNPSTGRFVNPGITEDRDNGLDDGIDNDCNGSEFITWYLDYDNDGYGRDYDIDSRMYGDTKPDGSYVANHNNLFDCDDTINVIHPGRVENYTDEYDSNCNGDNNDVAQRIIPDTGQFVSYTDTHGEDSDFLINSPSYIKLGPDGTILNNDATDWVAVKDEVTGLIWEVKTVANSDTQMPLADAEAYCQSLNTLVTVIENPPGASVQIQGLAGLQNWRMPTAVELSYIANSDLFNPSIEEFYFPWTTPSRFWTSTDTYGSGDTSMTISFMNGESYNDTKTLGYHVRAVSAGSAPPPAEPRFIDNNDGTVFDTKTGLMWQKDIGNNGTKLNWESALTYCDTLGLAGYTNTWRLPSKNELLSILTPGSNSEVFIMPNSALDDSVFWTSTSSPELNFTAWFVDFTVDSLAPSIIGRGEYTNIRFVRAVRGGYRGQ